MKVIDVFKQYISAQCVYSGVERKVAVVTLTATSDSGMITYEAGVSFFPHRDEEDYAVSYDAAASRVLLSESGRRTKKRDAAMLEMLQSAADECAAELNGKIFWDKPLREAQMG